MSQANINCKTLKKSFQMTPKPLEEKGVVTLVLRLYSSKTYYYITKTDKVSYKNYLLYEVYRLFNSFLEMRRAKMAINPPDNDIILIKPQKSCSNRGYEVYNCFFMP